MFNYIITHYKSVVLSEDFFKLENLLKNNSSDFLPPLLSRKIFPIHLNLIKTQGGFFAAETNNSVLAIVSYIKNYNGQNKFYDGSPYVPYILTNKQKRQNGCVRSTMQIAINQFREDGFNKIILETWSTNTASRNLFKSLGFCEVKIIKNGRQKGVDDIKLELRL